MAQGPRARDDDRHAAPRRAPAETNPLDLAINPLAKAALERATGLGVLKGWYRDWMARPPARADAAAFLDYTLGRLGCTLDLEPQERLATIPATGPVLIVANHPLGGIDGMLLARAFLAVRPDLKVLTNRLLKVFPEFDELFVGVDILSPDARRSNAIAMRGLARHLGRGGAVLMFPAPAVSELDLRARRVADPEWTPMAGRLALRSRATCVPVNIRARNAIWFYLAGLVHERLRTAMLVRAMLGQSGRTVRAAVGAPVMPDELAASGDGAAATLFLRRRCDELAL